ncbi:flagellin [Ralstonia soli]|uniref:Flagellin n=1 Tax=Ralstonia soli TaxID=2953896 RepID=A0ABT1APR2_9RALS|nr:flagellin [Ralstonia soli]MCO5400276.1 flagellin [Ralstonia soli]
MLSLNTNLSSLQTQQALNNSQSALQTSLQRLSTGLRINSAKDDAAGYAVSSQLTTTINSQNQGIANANNASSYLQTADSYLGQVENNLQQMRQLAVQANDGSLGTADLQNLGAVYDQLAGANAAIKTSANYNGNSLFTAAAATGVTFQTGQSATNDTVVAKTMNMTASITSAAGQITSNTGGADGTTAQNKVDADLASVQTARAAIGAQLQGISSNVSTLTSVNISLNAARSAITDTNYASETSNMTRQNILQQAGTAMLAQANSAPNSILSLLKG